MTLKDDDAEHEFMFDVCQKCGESAFSLDAGEPCSATAGASETQEIVNGPVWTAMMREQAAAGGQAVGEQGAEREWTVVHHPENAPEIWQGDKLIGSLQGSDCDKIADAIVAAHKADIAAEREKAENLDNMLTGSNELNALLQKGISERDEQLAATRQPRGEAMSNGDLVVRRLNQYALPHAFFVFQGDKSIALAGPMTEHAAESSAFAINAAMRAEREAAQKLCEIYFNIAAEAIGENNVRQRRDEMMSQTLQERKQ